MAFTDRELEESDVRCGLYCSRCLYQNDLTCILRRRIPTGASMYAHALSEVNGKEQFDKEDDMVGPPVIPECLKLP